MMRKLLFVLIALCGIMASYAQKTDAMLFGDVKSKTTGKHLPYAIISVKGTQMKTVADESGHFKMAHLPLGKQTITASLIGYQEQGIEVNMVSGKGSEVYFLLDDDVLNLDQVVVTGTRTQHYVKNVPIRTEVITSEALKNKNALNVYEALQGVPGIRVEQQCQFCNFSQVRMQGLGAEHTQVLIDGEPIYSGLAGVYGLQQMGTTDLDRIEVVKGAGSALYGSSAVAGAINLISKEPTFEPNIKADLQFGNWGLKSYNASTSLRNQRIGFTAFAQRMETDAIDATKEGKMRKEVKGKDGVSDRVESKLNNFGVGVYFYSPFAKNDKLVIRGKATQEDRVGGTMTDDAFRNPFTEGTENINTNRLTSELVYTLPIGLTSELNYSAAYVHHQRKATNDSFLSDYMATHDGKTPDVQSMRPYMAKENTFTTSLTFGSRLGDHNLLVGAQAYLTKLRETGMYCIADETSQYLGEAYTSLGKKHATEFGFFAQDEWNILDNLSVVPGVRLDTHRSGEEYESSKKVFDSAFPDTHFNETSVNPRLAIKYEVNPSLVLRANLGTGFRAPYGFSEDLHLCSGSPRVWKSSNLKAEKSMSFNLSADYYGKNYQLSANLFRTNLKNKIEFSDADEQVRRLGYTYQWENVDDAYVQGVELSVKYNPIRDIKLGVNWTFNQGQYKHERADWTDRLELVKAKAPKLVQQYEQYAKDSKNVSRFPAMTGDFVAEYTPGTWTFSLIGSLQGKMYIDYTFDGENDLAIAQNSKIKQTETFTIWNLRMAKRLGNFTLYAGGKNIFSYIQDEKHLDDAAFMYAPVYGATWYGGVSIKL